VASEILKMNPSSNDAKMKIFQKNKYVFVNSSFLF